MEYSICIPTFRRPKLLVELLHSIARQKSTFDLSNCEVVIVDNEPQGEGLRRVNELSFPFSVVTDSLAAPSLPGARNRCLELARGRYVIFLDDDQILSEGWLHGIASALRSTTPNCDGIVSSLMPRFECTLPWPLPTAKIYNRRRLPTGAPVTIKEARVCGAIASREVFNREKPPFDPRLHQVGGEDSDFFERAFKAGLVFASYDDIPIIERYGAERCSLGFIIRANLKIGYAIGLREWYAHGRLPLLKSLQRLSQAFFSFASCVPLLVVIPPIGLKALEYGLRNWGRLRGGHGRQMRYYGEAA